MIKQGKEMREQLNKNLKKHHQNDKILKEKDELIIKLNAMIQ